MKKQINLYQVSCYPKREKVTFKQFLVVVAICLLSVFILNFILAQQAEKIKNLTLQHRVVLKDKELQLSGLLTELQNNRAPESKRRELVALQAEIKGKQTLLDSLENIELAVTASFSKLMLGLSLADMDDISINGFSIINGVLNVSGQAKESDSLPLWLTNMQKTEQLSGIAFKTLEITNEKEGYSFKLTNKKESRSLIKGPIK